MIKLLIGGSPCTFWSIAQKNNRETEAEGMGWELFKNYLIAKEKFKPDFFLYENNKSAAQPIKDQISRELGVDLMYINSALVSAQNRQRFYAFNWEVEQPQDRGIILRDILESGVPTREKSVCIDACYYKGGNLTSIEKQSGQRLMAAEPVRIPDYGAKDKARPINALYPNNCGGFEHRMFSENPNKQQVDMIAEPVSCRCRGRKDQNGNGFAKYECRSDGKANTLDTNTTNGAMVAEPLNITNDGKSQTIKAQYQQTSPANILGYFSTYGASGVAEPVRVGAMPRPDGELSTSQAKRVYSIDGKSVNLVANGGGEGAKTGLYAIRVDEPMRVREATKQGYVDINVGDCVDLTQPNPKTRRGRSCKDKSNCLTTSNAQYEYCGVLGYATPIEWDENGIPTQAVSCADGKIYTVYEVKDGQITIKGKRYSIKLIDGYYIIRKLTPIEYERLQTLPDNYTAAVSNAQRYKGLGNGWTAEVIIHILNGALKDVPRDEEIVVLSMYDGIGTGRYCLDKMGFTNVKYFAYEIDKYAKQVAMSNYPDIIQMGDAFDLRHPDWTIGY